MPMLERYDFFQEAYFVNDVEEACHKWNKIYRAGPFVVTHHHKTDTFMYRGIDQEAGVLVNNYAEEKQRLLDLGFELACELHADDVDACYIDTRSINGGFTELHDDPPHILSAFASWKRAHELLRPGDPAIMPRPTG